LAGFPFSELIERLRAQTDAELLAGDPGRTTIQDRDVHRPGMGLMGYTTGFLPERVQVFGESEIGYLGTLDEGAQREAVRRILDLKVPGAFVARGLHVPAVLLEEADRDEVPLLRVPLGTEELVDLLRDILQDLFALRTNVHGTLVDVYGVGLLFTGRSGIGKSETALDLIERGHRLVADDLVEVVRRDDVLLGTGRKTLKHHMEIRGVGIVDVFPIFGVRSLRMQKRIEMEVQLEEWEQERNYDRMGLDRDQCEILGVRIPRVVVPIVPGKNITVIAEVLALDFMLKTYGIDSAETLNRKLIESMAELGRTTQYLRHDLE
jgi:HPr kinase/phosphorylase